MHKILVIDDEVEVCLLLERFLTKKGYAVDTVVRAEEGLSRLSKKKYDLVISDFRLPDASGLDLLKQIKELKPAQKVIIITGYSDIRMAVEVIKYGALDYVTKPLYPEELLNLIEESISREQSHGLSVDTEADDKESESETPAVVAKTKSKPKKSDPHRYIIGNSPGAKTVYENIRIVAPTDMSVIISGETGTGKEFVAREVHRLSNRSDKPFIAIDCGALPKDIAGSEFFGHEKGAFTGAIRTKDGKFKLADGGTLFLDEIGNLSYEIQIKLLRVLQEQKYTRIGGDKDISVDVRILAASNEDLKKAVAEGKFREDLYYRLNEFRIHIQPLRNRTEDIEEFTDQYLANANDQLGKNVKGLSPQVLRKFKTYPWPGNLRELRNVMKRSVLMAQEDMIELHHLPDEITYHSEQTVEDNGKSSLKGAAEQAEKEKIVKVLSETGNNKSKTAKLLNIDRKTLYNKLKSYGILNSNQP